MIAKLSQCQPHWQSLSTPKEIRVATPPPLH
jgi:hypothetical protein